MDWLCPRSILPLLENDLSSNLIDSHNNDWEWFTLSFEEPPHINGDVGAISMNDVKLVLDFICLNKEVLLHYWEKKEPLHNIEPYIYTYMYIIIILQCI
jgi:hypothetical protein